MVIRVRTDEGIDGFGEATPFYMHLGTMEESLAALTHYVIPFLVGRDPMNITEIITGIEKILPHNYYAKEAVDFALWDIIGKSLRLPLYLLFGGRVRERVPLAWTIGICDPEEASSITERRLEEGFKAFKVKIGANPERDVKRVEAVRRTAGEDVEIWVDCNQGYTVKQALGVIRAIERFDPVAVEQPVSRHDIVGLSRLSRLSRLPIMPDESFQTPEQIVQLICLKACDMLSFKIEKLGGLYRSREASSIASAARIPVILASNLGSGISVAAGAHFYVSTSIVAHAAELTGPLFMNGDVVKEGCLRIEDGYLYPPNEPGLGITVEEASLQKYLVKS